MLPKDILLQVFLEATDNELNILSQTNKLFHSVALDEYFWKLRGIRYFGDDYEKLKSSSKKNYRDTYILFRALQKLNSDTERDWTGSSSNVNNGIRQLP